jgi:hypothetical protein
MCGSFGFFDRIYGIFRIYRRKNIGKILSILRIPLILSRLFRFG